MASVCLSVCQHDNFRTNKHRMMELDIVQKSRPSSNVGVIVPWLRTPKCGTGLRRWENQRRLFSLLAVFILRYKVIFVSRHKQFYSLNIISSWVRCNATPSKQLTNCTPSSVYIFYLLYLCILYFVYCIGLLYIYVYCVFSRGRLSAQFSALLSCL